MLNGQDDNGAVNALEERFGAVERRVRRLLDRNRFLEERVSELERELNQSRVEARGLEAVAGTRTQLREKIERVLQSLEALKPGGGEGRERG